MKYIGHVIICYCIFFCHAQAQLTADTTISTPIENNLAKAQSQRLKSLMQATNLLLQKGNQPAAQALLHQSVALKDSLLTMQTSTTIQALTNYYETYNKDKAIQLQQAELKKQQWIIVAITITAVFIIIVMLLNFKRKQLVSAQKMQQQSMQAIIQAEEKERNRIAAELHDGVGQMMSAVKMNLSSLSNKLANIPAQENILLQKTLLLIDESCKEIRTVSHNMMPNVLLKAGLASAIKAFVDKIDHNTLQVNLYTEGLEQQIHGTQETILYRAIQEAVNNVIKHAAANKLDISLLKDAEGITCTIEDNGKGFSTTQQNTGIGMQNIRSRIQFLQGTVEWNSQPNKGTLVAIYIPVQQVY